MNPESPSMLQVSPHLPAPDAWLVLAGPTRTGTTALFRHLAQAAPLRPSLHKETDYFLHALRAGIAPDVPAYRQLFVTGEGCRMEASPLYFAFGSDVAGSIATLPGDVKILLTLREPVARFRSLLTHVQTKRRVAHPPDAAAFVAAALKAENTPPDPHDIDRLAFREGCYVDLLREWVDVFGESRIRVIFFESLQQESHTVLTDLYHWLALPPASWPPFVLAQENASREVNWRRLHQMAMTLNALLEPLLNRTHRLRAALRAIYYRFNGARTDDPLPPHLAEQLRAAYAVRNTDLRRQVQSLALGPVPDWVP